jgi:hypothetical protein
MITKVKIDIYEKYNGFEEAYLASALVRGTPQVFGRNFKCYKRVLIRLVS